jgi:hypothetical protein
MMLGHGFTIAAAYYMLAECAGCFDARGNASMSTSTSTSSSILRSREVDILTREWRLAQELVAD